MYEILLCSGVEVIVDVEEPVLWWYESDVMYIGYCPAVILK